jgi:SpoIID/LytB domain protein
MCQRGAQNHAREGWNCKQILQHYYTGVEIRKL